MKLPHIKLPDIRNLENSLERGSLSHKDSIDLNLKVLYLPRTVARVLR